MMIKNFKKHLQNSLYKIHFQKWILKTESLPFVTQYQPSVSNLKQIIMNEWHLIENKNIF